MTQGKAFLLSALSDIPHCILKNAYECKLADRERNTYRVALSMAEIKSSKRRQDLLKSIRECRKRDVATNEEQITLLENLLGIKNATIDDIVGDEDLERANREDGLVELGVSDEEVGYLEEAIQLQGREWGRTSSDEDGPGDSSSVTSPSDDEPSSADRY